MAFSRIWVVRAADPRAVGPLLTLAGGDPRALAEGRVFVGKRRAERADERLEPGDTVTIAAPAPAPAPAPGAFAAPASEAKLVILAEADGLVAVDKPAGIPTIPDHGGSAHALSTRLASALRADPRALHPTSRLDRLVSGVVIFARTKAAAAHLMDARARGAYERRYVALTGKAPEPASGRWEQPIGRARDARKRQAGGRDAAPASTLYLTVAQTAGQVAGPAVALLALSPLTGRTHQLRVHASHAGAPLLGDRDYGGLPRVVTGAGSVHPLERIALHAARVRVPRPGGREVLEVRSPIPIALVDLWRTLGGAPDAWDSALAWVSSSS